MDLEEFLTWQKGLKLKLENSIKGTIKSETRDKELKALEKEIEDYDQSLLELLALKDASFDFDVSYEEINELLVKIEDFKLELEQKLKKLKKMKELDFGPHNEYAVLYGEKMEFDLNDYSYVIQFFDQAYQLEGNMKYVLGY